MALSTYSDLQASVASWLNRSDLMAQIPDFIALAESSIANEVRLRDMVTVTTLATTGADFVELPANWLEFKYVKHENKPLEYIAPDLLRSKFNDTGTVKFYSMEGNRLLLNPTPGILTLDMAYFARLPALATTATNAILTKHPQIYLCKTLAIASAFIMDAAKAAQWDGLYKEAVSSAKGADGAAMSSGSPLRIRTR